MSHHEVNNDSEGALISTLMIMTLYYDADHNKDVKKQQHIIGRKP